MQTQETSLPDVFQKSDPLGQFIRLEEKVKGIQVLRKERIFWTSKPKKGATS